MQGVGTEVKEQMDDSVIATGLRSFGRGFTILERELTLGPSAEEEKEKASPPLSTTSMV